ncbi:hypothetical protein [Anaerovorax sp. IOR16]|uniref:hypothetical protein n=1 Tax=Anaerovorax sp. IOR16 TaxID=2773458 RepID=UPI0019D2BE59|nr:hypothetical protein [Anaerovorax sp. IOR16]
MVYADYTFYTGTYKGNSIPESDFDRFILRASSYIERMCGTITVVTENVKMAACAVAEAWQINEQGGDVVSQSVGPWSKSYQKTIKTDSARLLEAAQLYLGDLVKTVRWC